VNPHLEEDELALFAMHLLSEPEAAAVALNLEKSEDARRRLAEILATLAAYAEASIELHEVPQGSLDRLLARTTQKKDVVPVPVSPRIALPRPRSSFGPKVMPWIGWAVAVAMIMVAGKLYRDRAELRRALNNQTSQVAHVSADTTDVYRERDALRATLSKQSEDLASLRTEIDKEKREAGSLQTIIAGETTELDQQKAKVTAQATHTDDAARDVQRLEQTVAAQASELATLRTDERKARQVLDALTDRTALRVTLTKPKTKAAPVARATYVASRGTLVFLASNLGPLNANKVYQLWLMPVDQSKPVPAGTFVPDARGNATIVNTQFLQPLAAKGFSVTIEKQGGSQIPTLPIILAGE
jgi:Anti-sigma-K factor rskA